VTARIQFTHRRAWLLLLGGVVVGVTLLAGIATLRLLSVADDLDEARRLVTSAGDALELGDLAVAEAELATASDILVSANNRLHSSVTLELVGGLPVVSRNLSVVEDSVGLAMQIALGSRELLAASDALEAADGRLELPLSAGAIPVGSVRAVQAELAALAAVLPTLDELPDGTLLLPKVRDARAELYVEASHRRQQADVLSRALDLLIELSGGNGSRRYLIAVANTAEMRGAGGMVLNYGVLTGSGGDFELGDFGRIDELALAAPLSREDVSQVPDDYLARWQGFDPLLRWRNATMAAEFELVAPVLEEMYEEATGEEVDGVVQIDPHGLAAILEGTGPVTVGELGVVDAANVADLTLHVAYERFPDIEDRSDVLGDVAEAVFRKLVDGEYESLRPLADAVVRAVEARHIQVHTRVGPALARLRSFRATGDFPDLGDGDLFHLTVQNLSGHKLDYYLDTALALSGTRSAGEVGRLGATITVTNGAPPGRSDPEYVFVPFDTDQAVGSYRGVVSLYVPRGTSLESFSGDVIDGPVVVTEGGRPVISFTTDIRAGEQRSFALDLTLPPAPNEPYGITVVPSPRFRPTTFTADIQTHAGDVTGAVALDRTWWFRPRTSPTPLGTDE
jgi:hypothetical protein